MTIVVIKIVDLMGFLIPELFVIAVGCLVVDDGEVSQAVAVFL